MRQKLPFLHGRRASPEQTPTPTRLPWRVRRREREQPRPSTSQSDFNSIRINTSDYPIDLLRQYEDGRNVSSNSQPRSSHQPSHSDEPDPPPKQPRRRPPECLFLTSGYRINATDSPNLKDLLAASKHLSDAYDGPFYPPHQQSREGFFLRGKACILLSFILLAFITVIGLSWYYTCRSNLERGPVHALVMNNPLAKLLRRTNLIETPPDARHMWINHVVKNDHNQILIAETFESRLNAEISPMLEQYVDKIWDHASSPPMACHGGDRLMVAFSTAKAASIPASVTYETPCTNGPSLRSCVVKKQIADVRDLIVQLPSKSSRYMHAVRLEIDYSSKENSTNTSDVRRTQDLGTVSGQFRVELSDASRLALQRYCGQDRKAYSEDLMTVPVSAHNTRLINVYELKRLYGLLSSESVKPIVPSNAWDTRMLSTIVVDPLEHSKHGLAPTHIQELLSRLGSGTSSLTIHGTHGLRSPRISVSRPQENDLFRHSAAPSPHVSAMHNDVATNASSPTSSPSPLLSSSAHVQTDITQQVSSFNVQLPASPSLNTDKTNSGLKDPIPSSREDTEKKALVLPHDDSPSVQLQRKSEYETASNPDIPADAETTSDRRKETTDYSTAMDDDKGSASVLHSSGAPGDTNANGTATGNSNPTEVSVGEVNYKEASNDTISQDVPASAVSAKRSTVPHVSGKTGRVEVSPRWAVTSPHEGASVPTQVPLTPPAPSRSSQSVPPDPNIYGQRAPATPNLTMPPSGPSSTLTARPQEPEARKAAKPATGKQLANPEVAVTGQETIHSNTNRAQRPRTTNPALHSPVQSSSMSLSKVPTPADEGALFPNQGARSSIKQQFPSNPRMSQAHHLSTSEGARSASSVGGTYPIQRKLSPAYERLSATHGSTSGIQSRSPSMEGRKTLTGQVPLQTNRGTQRTNAGFSVAQKDLQSYQRSLFSRGPQSRAVIPRSVTRTQRNRTYNTDASVWTPRSVGRKKSGASSQSISIFGGHGLETSRVGSQSRAEASSSIGNPMKT